MSATPLTKRFKQGWGNVWRIFVGDMRHLVRNVIIALVTMGLILVPPLYAWFTTLGFWDPYSNTGNLSVAVANEDAGYSSDLIPVRINAGDTIVSTLRANNAFKWQFVDEQRALEGVKSGSYYAAIVIPADFTANLMTVFTARDIQPAHIVYYSNEKENAIAPRVTSTGVSTLQEDIDEAFTKSIANIALESTSNLSAFMNGDGLKNYGSRLLDNLNMIIADLNTASQETQLFAALVSSTSTLLDSTSTILGDISTSSDSLPPLLESTNTALQSAAAASAGVESIINSSAEQTSKSFDAITNAVDQAYTVLKNDPQTALALLNSLQVNIADTISTLTTLRDLIDTSVTATPSTKAALDKNINQAITDLQAMETSITELKNSLSATASEVDQSYSKAQQAIAQAKASFGAFQNTYGPQLQAKLEDLSQNLSTIQATATNLADGVGSASASLSDTSSNLSSSLTSVQTALTQTADLLGSTANQLTDTRNQLQSALASNNLTEVRKIIGDNPETVAAFLSSPTKLVRKPVYEVANNGSSMSSFYTSLALWIGAIFSVALASTTLSKRRIATLDNPRPWQLYLGRFGVFAFFSLSQATILCLGNVLFLGVQCEHLFLYLLAAWIVAFVFANIVYTLTVSFGNMGKALAIILLVMQLAGSGGLMPVQMTAPLFQAIYPWLPFSHSMLAFQGCIAGIYGWSYWQSIAALLLTLVPMLVLGLALRNPIIRLITFINTKLDETEVL